LAGRFFQNKLRGIVPVAVDTLLTADDYSCSQALLVGGETLPAIKSAL
jgi:hypothetical protein